jgi:hypothetical protein
MNADRRTASETGVPEETAGADLRWVQWSFAALAGVGFLAALMYALATAQGVERAGILGSALLVAGAFALIGGLIGFVFAIPRSRQAERGPQLQSVNPEEPPRRLSDYAANTNLEQISDWLTKILVGVSLIQFDELSARFGEAATSLAPMLGGGSTARPATLALMTYFSAWGFFLGYLLTRLWLPKALSRAEREEHTRQLRAERQVEEEAELRALERRAYDHLYEPEPGGFTRAIEAIEAYQNKRDALPSPWLWLYLAAAYGQKHRFEQEQDRREEAERAREKARVAAQNAVNMNPSTRPILERLYRGIDPNENDLASLQRDDVLDQLLLK